MLPAAAVHPESLLRLSPIRQMFADARVTLKPRPVDKTWTYARRIPIVTTGFNPYRSEIYYGERSALADWLHAPEDSARRFNESDFLVKEALFSAHDYLHIWAVHAIQTLAPELGFGRDPITQQNLEAFTFCHLLTEAVAVVGLDYWFLSTLDLDTVLPIGSEISHLTVNYHERHAREYRRFNPTFEVQSPEFFGDIARFYGTGVFVGFALDDVRASPRLLSWLKHELSYGAMQRRYVREWLAYMSADADAGSDTARPLDCSAPWQSALIEALGHALWSKIKHGHDACPAAGYNGTATTAWKRAKHRPIDLRFTSIHSLPRDAWPEIAASSLENRRYFAFQMLSAMPLDDADDALLRQAEVALREGDITAALKLVDGQKMLAASADEPADLFLPN